MRGAAILAGVLLIGSGFAAGQHTAVDKSAPETSAEHLQQALGKNAKMLVIDVRSPQEFTTGHIPGAVNIPIDELAGKLKEMKVTKDTTLVTTCEHGGRSSRAAVELHKLGYLTASYCTLDAWKKCGYKVDTGDGKPRAAATVHKFTCRYYGNSGTETAELVRLRARPAQSRV